MNSQLLGSPSSTANHPSLLFPPPESLPPHKKHHPNGSAPRAIRLGNTDGTSPALNALLGLLIQLLHPGDESLHNPTAHGAEQHMTGGIQLAVLAPEDGLVGPKCYCRCHPPVLGRLWICAAETKRRSAEDGRQKTGREALRDVRLGCGERLSLNQNRALFRVTERLVALLVRLDHLLFSF